MQAATSQTTAEPNAAEHNSTAAAEQNATATGQNATAFAAVYDFDYNYFEAVLVVQAFVMTFVLLFVTITPMIVGVYSTLYVLVTELVFRFNLICPHLCNTLYYLMYHCHVVFLAVFVLVALIGFFIAMWRSSNFGIQISIHRDDEVIAE